MFSFTIFSSVVFICLFSTWVIRATSLIRQETHVHFNKPSRSLDLKPIYVDTLTGFSINFSRRPENLSGFATVSVLKGLQGNQNESKTSFDSGNADAVSGQLSGSQQDVAETIEDSISEKISRKKRRGNCDVTKGRWVYDENYSLYTSDSCPFIDESFDCVGNGRFDKDYMKWRWQPDECDIPRFDAAKMLDLIRGKRLVFVGDSINRNQWESMLCMLLGAVKDPKKVYETHHRRITKEKGNYSFRFVDYKCTVEYYVTHFLVHESKARVGKKRVQTLQIDTMDRGSSRWRGADILVFNTAHWWSHYKTKSGINYYQEGNQVHPRLDVSTAFRKALMTWAFWINKHVNPKKTQVFFRSSAPSHFRGGQWNTGGHCKEATRPLDINTSNVNYVKSKNLIVEEVIRQTKMPVTILNVTSLSGYRIDGHPSIYGRKPEKGYSSNVEDCSHWCLPGVPDTWNELLFFHLQAKKSRFTE